MLLKATDLPLQKTNHVHSNFTVKFQ